MLFIIWILALLKFSLDRELATQKSSDPQGPFSMTQTHRDGKLNDTAAHTHEEAKGLISQSTEHRSTCDYSIFQVWWVEAAACFLSMVALSSFGATLYPHQYKPLPQWLYNISVNSLISIYVIVLKAMILFVITECMSQLKW